MNDFALLLTWTCYGTWLPGDARGYVSNTRNKRGGFVPLHNLPGTPITTDDRDSRNLAKESQRYATTRLTEPQAEIAAKAIIDAAQERHWKVRRGAIMANHVHLVVAECPDDGSAVRRIFKGVSQARLSDHTQESRRWWTQGGSDRYLHGVDAIEAAIRYVANQDYCLIQIENGLLIRTDGGDKPRRSLG